MIQRFAQIFTSSADTQHSIVRLSRRQPFNKCLRVLLTSSCVNKSDDFGTILNYLGCIPLSFVRRVNVGHSSFAVQSKQLVVKSGLFSLFIFVFVFQFSYKSVAVVGISCCENAQSCAFASILFSKEVHFDVKDKGREFFSNLNESNLAMITSEEFKNNEFRF